MASHTKTDRKTHPAGWWIACLGVFFSIILPACNSAPLPVQPAAQSAAIASPTSSLSQATPSAGIPSTPTVTPIMVITPAPTRLPSPTPTPPECWEVGGYYELGALETDLLRRPLEFRVYLPPCYNEQPERTYPTLYLIHGQSYTDDQWERLGAGAITSELAAIGELPPFLIVMPRDLVWTEPTQDRFGQAVSEVLLPWIEANYRTLPERQFRAVGGLSRGGAWALHIGMTHPELFGAIGLHSGFVFHTDAPDVRGWLEQIPPEQMPRFYMDVANNDRADIYNSAVWFENLLTTNNIPHEWHIFTGYHKEEYWQAHVEQYLRWYALGWEEVP